MAKALLLLIVFYRKGISPYLKPRCRYSPTCSQYAYEAIKIHGAILGILLAAFRILRCNPFSRGGYDPPPPKHFYKMGLW
ncbi:MAG: membrane protein insertion efficiency factor YidD [Defluviitaleaceae bacterium]|nr:membrane protein insertion efficiency factor YidD [Defluviitaleaceae bacterium]